MKSILNTLVVLCALFYISVGSSLKLHDTEERMSEPCNIPSDVAYCMDVMRVGTRFNDESAQHFARLEDLLSEHALEECSWESFEGKKSPDECISTLSRFSENSVPPISSSTDLDFSEHIVRVNKACYNACKIVKGLKCWRISELKWGSSARKKCMKKVKRKCRKKCKKS
ncbi:hypothetical protein BWQ96_09182 [Gracilariopsis chorda]|uniref:Uncharacterized protein n=1 Tax=Gracilariopsis chorda TaxID=448386 RepID=A0A2V3IGF5_9FLOR|nr:hypothetical protein BWQ96_09182 [Gracilariopsis chorda]|eukprot:PXF41103.1 hypothetical protein BWQ96_09182 [Gracilariopsis chorda]